MKSYLNKLLIILLLSSFFVPLTVNAIEIRNPLEYDSLAELLEAIVGFLMKLAIPIAVIMIVVAGFYFVTAMGEPEKINTAKRIILWTLIGLVIILCAWGLIEVIEDIFK